MSCLTYYYMVCLCFWNGPFQTPISVILWFEMDFIWVQYVFFLSVIPVF